MAGIARTIVAITLFLAPGCYLHESGTWEDDPKNWARAFGTRQPDDVTVVHSHYWRSPHWTYECRMRFEFEPNSALRDEIIQGNALRRMRPAELLAWKGISAEGWFAPGPADKYDAWTLPGADDPELVLLEQKQSAQLWFFFEQL